MSLVTVICDRCKRSIEGLRTGSATGGFYDIEAGGWWAGFADPGEKNVCDDCMHSDPRYVAVYGKRRVFPFD